MVLRLSLLALPLRPPKPHILGQLYQGIQLPCISDIKLSTPLPPQFYDMSFTSHLLPLRITLALEARSL
jgi:hypothetical protein